MLSNALTRSLAGLLLLAPLTALAADRCDHSAAKSLTLDLNGVKALVFEVHSHELRLTAKPGNSGQLSGRACASNAERLAQLTLTQARVGDKLVVSLRREGNSVQLFGNHYGYLDISGTVPDNLPVQLKVGSGDADVEGAAIVSADVGSGDANVRRTRGLVAAKVGSGDVLVEDAGALNVISIGSGDAIARNVRGNVDVGDIGSGDFTLDRATGNVQIGSIGSGNADLRKVDGSVVVESVGSGDVEARDVRGGLRVRSIGSGSIEHSNVTGALDLPRGH